MLSYKRSINIENYEGPCTFTWLDNSSPNEFLECVYLTTKIVIPMGTI